MYEYLYMGRGEVQGERRKEFHEVEEKFMTYHYTKTISLVWNVTQTHVACVIGCPVNPLREG